MAARVESKSWRWALGCIALGLARLAAANTGADGNTPAPLPSPMPMVVAAPSVNAPSFEPPRANTLRPPMHDYAIVARAAATLPLPGVDTAEPAQPVPSTPPAATEPEPALTLDAGGLPRISGFQHNAPKTIVDLVEAMAPTYQLAPELVLAFMQAESSYNPNALSPKNARGLMQLIPGTAERFNVRKPFDPKQNIRGGMAYLRWLLAYFEGDLTLVAAGYNAGERRVDRYLGVPPYGETRAYVKRVVDALGIDAHPYDASITEPSARLEQIRASRAKP